MKLVMSGLEHAVEVESGCISTLQVENEALFARIVRSIASLQGREAIEPFTIWENGAEIKPQSALLFVSDLLHLPWDDRALMGEVLKRIEREFLEDEDLRRAVESMDSSIAAKLLDLGFGMNSDYRFGLEWDFKRYLKFRGFGADPLADESLLDNVLNFLSLALDAGCEKIITFVNLKTFLTKNEVETLSENVFYLKANVLLLENKRDEMVYDNERKLTVDLDFFES